MRVSRRRTTRLTSDGIKFILFTFAISLAAVNTGNNLFYLILSMMLSCIVISGLLSEYCLRRLEFHRHLPDLIMANEPATLTLSIANRNRRLSSFSLRLFDVIGGQNIDRGLFLQQLPRRVLCSCPIRCSPPGAAGSGSKASGCRRSFLLDSFAKQGFILRIPSWLSRLPSSRSLCDSWMSW